MSSSRASVRGRQPYVEGARFATVRVCYLPVLINGPYSVRTLPFHRPTFIHLAEDLPLIKGAMGANMVRVYGWSKTADHTAFLDAAHANGLKVMATSTWCAALSRRASPRARRLERPRSRRAPPLVAGQRDRVAGAHPGAAGRDRRRVRRGGPQAAPPTRHALLELWQRAQRRVERPSCAARPHRARPMRVGRQVRRQGGAGGHGHGSHAVVAVLRLECLRLLASLQVHQRRGGCGERGAPRIRARARDPQPPRSAPSGSPLVALL